MTFVTLHLSHRGGGFRIEWLEWEGGWLAGVHFEIQLRRVFLRTALAVRVQMGLRARRLKAGELARPTGPTGHSGPRAFCRLSRGKHSKRG